MDELAGLMVIMSVPGLMLLLVVFAAIDRLGSATHRRLRLPWRGDEVGRSMAAPGIDELHALFYATKRHELDQRRTSLVMRDDETDGAPPHSEVDLNAGIAVIRQSRGGTGGSRE